MPPQVIIYTSSPRRYCQLKRIQSKWKIGYIRGNIETRLAKLNEGRYNAIILAAGLIKRLQLENRISEYPRCLEIYTGYSKRIYWCRLLVWNVVRKMPNSSVIETLGQ